jgi:hypothetical protein
MNQGRRLVASFIVLFIDSDHTRLDRQVGYLHSDSAKSGVNTPYIALNMLSTQH